MFRVVALAAVLVLSSAAAAAPGNGRQGAPQRTAEFHCGKTFITFTHFGPATGTVIHKTIRKAAILGLSVPADARGRAYISVVEDPVRPAIVLGVPGVLRKSIIECLD